jgi:alpha,alpha-trehalase
MQKIRSRMRTRWRDLTSDSVEAAANGARILYLRGGQKPGRSQARRLRASGVEVRTLPADIRSITEHGPVFLPYKFVQPGGRFLEHERHDKNEPCLGGQFGWDSWATVRGLLADNHVRLSRHMTDNQLYMVRQYGDKVLNASHTWSLGRSHPPFLTRMILDVYGRTNDRAWLASTLDAVEAYHRYWTTGGRVTPETGLARYDDEMSGPASEVAAADTGEYERTKEMFRRRPPEEVARYYDARSDRLTDRFHDGERRMRASGLDTTDRWGPAGADTGEFNPVELNALLWQMEMDAAEIARLSGRPRSEVDRWRRRARERKKLINKYLWDPKRGLYMDYHWPSNTRSDYPYVTTFFPLWAGSGEHRLASKRQAARVMRNLHLFEVPGGLTGSVKHTGHQWDRPFAWAILVSTAVGGMRRHGFDREADRVSVNYLSMVLAEFLRTGEIYEKYDGEHRDARVDRVLRFGYTTNETGFAMTNGVFRDLYRQLKPSQRARVRDLDGQAVPPPASRAGRPRGARADRAGSAPAGAAGTRPASSGGRRRAAPRPPTASVRAGSFTAREQPSERRGD